MRNYVAPSTPIRLFALSEVPAQCDRIALAWTGGTSNYTIEIISQVAPVFTPPVLTALGLSDNSITWTANLCGGAPVTIVASDSGFTVSFTLSIAARSERDFYILWCIAGAPPVVPYAGHNALVVAGIVIIASALGWRAYRSRRRRHQTFVQGTQRCSAAPAWNERRNTLLVEALPPAYACDRNSSDPDHGGDGRAIQPVPSVGSMQMTELPRMVGVAESLAAASVTRPENDTTSTQATAVTGNTPLAGDSNRARLDGDGRAVSAVADDGILPPAY
ncbi:hypothetical protein OH76DRAFT_1489101 [Lentinus brumalis]|uniref:Uncharacterized protein n=1 Tax=Lentinus brumalis TaxID=2498619 RepID=A0A371CNP8_9APHY|nr:hypothetical protein OH76DRAFT_1489101 [Polyporus brumalis]